MLYNSLNIIKDNLKRDIDLDFSPFKYQVKLNYNFIIPTIISNGLLQFLLKLLIFLF